MPAKMLLQCRRDIIMICCNINKRRKKITDTLWHRVKNITLINQNNDSVSLDQFAWKSYCCRFFFTHCPKHLPGAATQYEKFAGWIEIKKRNKNYRFKFVQFHFIYC